MQWAYAISSSLACPALPYFSTLSHKRHDFRKHFIEHKFCLLIFLNFFFSETVLILRTRRDIFIMYTGFHIKYPLFLSDLNENCIFWTGFRIILKYKSSWTQSSDRRLVSCGRTNRWRDFTKPVVAFHNFAKAPKHLHSAYITHFSALYVTNSDYYAWLVFVTGMEFLLRGSNVIFVLRLKCTPLNLSYNSVSY